MTADQRAQLEFYRAKAAELRGRLRELPGGG
jgi:hypothetical protein